MGQIHKIVADALAFNAGDPDAALRLLRRGVPLAARAIGLPAPLVEAGEALYDHVARDTVRVGRDGSYVTPGAGRFARWLLSQESGVYLTLGAPGSGKTAFNCQLADRWTASVKYMAGVPASPLRGTPLRPFALTPTNIRRLPEGAVLIIPDAAFEGLDSRDHGSSLETTMRALLTVTRHRSVRVLVDSQSTNLMAKSLFNTPAALFIRPLGVTWQIAERDGFTKYARAAMAGWAEIPPEDRFDYIFAISDAASFIGFVRAGIPDWYSDALSKSHSLADDEDLGIVDGEFAEVDQ